MLHYTNMLKTVHKATDLWKYRLSENNLPLRLVDTHIHLETQK